MEGANKDGVRTGEGDFFRLAPPPFNLRYIYWSVVDFHDIYCTSYCFI